MSFDRVPPCVCAYCKKESKNLIAVNKHMLGCKQNPAVIAREQARKDEKERQKAMEKAMEKQRKQEEKENRRLGTSGTLTLSSTHASTFEQMKPAIQYLTELYQNNDDKETVNYWACKIEVLEEELPILLENNSTRLFVSQVLQRILSNEYNLDILPFHCLTTTKEKDETRVFVWEGIDEGQWRVLNDDVIAMIFRKISCASMGALKIHIEKQNKNRYGEGDEGEDEEEDDEDNDWQEEEKEKEQGSSETSDKRNGRRKRSREPMERETLSNCAHDEMMQKLLKIPRDKHQNVGKMDMWTNCRSDFYRHLFKIGVAPPNHIYF